MSNVTHNLLGDVFTWTKGRKPVKLSDSKEADSIPYLTASYFRTGDVASWTTPQDNTVVRAKDDDVILIWDGSNAGDVFMGLQGALASTMVKFSNSNKYLNAFLYFFLKTKFKELNEGTTGSTIPHVSGSILKDFELPNFDLSIQTKISHILSKIQEAIENQDKIIKTTTELKAALMKKIFSEGLKKWEKVEFSKALHPAKKLGKSKQILSSQIKKEGKYPVVDQGQDFIAGFCDDETKVVELKNPVIIFGDHTRFFKYIDFSFVIGADGVKVLEADTATFNPKFLFHYLNSLKISSRGYNRHFKILKEQSILKPSMDDQLDIAHTFDVIDAKIENAKKLTGAKTDLFKSMLNNLMSGETRVNNITL